ncbi:hypothetical protein [Virgibacillus kimchii]
MNRETEDKVISQYKEDEKNMILLFVQWCVNHDIDPVVLYQTAYPGQAVNDQLSSVLEQAVPKEEAEAISNELLLEVLDFFGNHDLAQVVYEVIERGKNEDQ